MFHQRLSLQYPYRATVGQQAPHSQAINKPGIIMKPNESPSIFPKQATDLKVGQQQESLSAFQDKPQHENKSQTLNVSLVHYTQSKRPTPHMQLQAEVCAWIAII